MSRDFTAQLEPSMSDIEAWSALGAGTALLLFGVTRRPVPGIALTLAAAPLLYRGLAGRWPDAMQRCLPGDDTKSKLADRRGTRVREAVQLEVPVAEVYRFWRRLENLPRFMTHLEAVTVMPDGRSHWVARGPAGVRVEWDAEIINEEENQVIGWRSLPGSDVVTAGSVNFDSVRAGRSTRVTVHLQYAAPGNRAGAFIASLFGRAPSQTIREDLRRLKQVLEAGEIVRAVPSSEA